MKLSVVLLIVFAVLLVGCEPETGQISGVVTSKEAMYDAGKPLLGVDISLEYEGEIIATAVTDDEGIYLFADVAPGTYTANLSYAGEINYKASEHNIFIEAGDVEIIDFDLSPGDAIAPASAMHDVVAGKPNIYLYPVEETEVSVSLNFAGEGYITTTIPDYGDGWTVTITPDGRIDDEYDFLFYEGVVDAETQYTHGWLIVQEELESFFRVNMRAYGFRGQEIEDFVEFWVPRLTDKPMYVIYPQLNEDYDNLVALTIDPQPDTVLRLAYTIRGVDIFDGPLLAPELPTASFIVPQEREGFWVTEWGVLLTNEDFKQYIH